MPENNFVTIQLNGVECFLNKNATVLDAIQSLKPASEFVAAELNGNILEKLTFSSTFLKNGDVLEIIQPLGGGNR